MFQVANSSGEGVSIWRVVFGAVRCPQLGDKCQRSHDAFGGARRGQWCRLTTASGGVPFGPAPLPKSTRAFDQADHLGGCMNRQAVMCEAGARRDVVRHFTSKR